MYLEENAVEINENLKKNIEFVANYSNFSNCYSDEKFCNTIDEIGSQFFDKKNIIQKINWTCTVKFHEGLIAALNACISKETNETIDFIKKKYLTAKKMFNICRTFSNHSLMFCNCFYRSSGMKVIFIYINDDHFRQLLTISADKSQLQKLLRSILGCLVNLSQSYAVYKNDWKIENSTKLILDLSNSSKIEDTQIACYMILARTSEEEEIKKFPNLIKIIPRIALMIERIALRLERQKKISRTHIQVNDQLIEYVSQISIDATVWHLIELLDALYCMVVNDSIKETVYFEFKMNKCLRKLIYHGNENEMSHAVRFLWQLCFNKKIAEDVLNDSELTKILETNSSNSTNLQSLRANCKGCLWLINNKLNINLIEEANEGEGFQVNHIMISYNRDSRDICVKIKQDLENIGHKIWIDVENIHGSSLEAMAKAIEDSKCVLMCMTEKYKQSTNCRAEAEYAFQLNKPIIPLIMQQDYKPDGWLGIILGSKIFVNFTKYNYDECLRRVKHELSKIAEIKKSDSLNRPNLNENKAIENWTEVKVSEWFKDKNINSTICENLLPCDGETLKQLFDIMQNAPEFFYASISSDKKVPLKDIAYFAKEIKNIFK